MNKVDFICYIIVRNCNPNGDFEENNRPKQDLDTGLGIMTDVCIKRKIRDAVNVLRDGIPGYDMYIKNDHIALESKVSFMFPAEEEKHILSLTPAQRDSYIKGLLCSSYFDVRAFGAAVTYLANKRYCDGQMTGAVQIGFAESLEPITPVKHVITRVDVSTEADLKKKDRELGTKWTVPYAVYKFEGHVSAGMAKKNGFTEDDLSVLIEAIQKMFARKMLTKNLEGNSAWQKMMEPTEIESKEVCNQAQSEEMMDNHVEEQVVSDLELEV